MTIYVIISALIVCIVFKVLGTTLLDPIKKFDERSYLSGLIIQVVVTGLVAYALLILGLAIFN